MENAEKFKKIFRGILSVGQRKSEDALRSLQTQIQDFVQGRKTAEEFMEEMTKALEVENSHTVILKFLENTSFSCETTYSLERSKLRTSSNHPSGSPPLRTQSSLLSSAQLNREAEGNLVGNLGGLGAGDSEGESDGSSDGQGELEDYPGSHDKE
jgi:hypothetical protein